jgi:cbb3-type cytochrome oxidase maturation protein
MSVLFVVLPLALLVSAMAVVAFVFAVRRGEFDDLETPARRILTEDASPDAGELPPSKSS